MKTSTRVVRSVHLDLGRDAAWDLVGTEAGLARWLGGDVSLDPTAGAALRVRDDDGVERVGRVLAVDAGRALTFEWADDEGADPSTVTFTVTEDGDGSRVTVVEERAGGSVAACADAGDLWEHRMLHLEVGALALRANPALV
jgi:uncharacterized protein YndB with AHSA1/START domain